MNWHNYHSAEARSEKSQVAQLRAELAEVRREIAALKQFKKAVIPGVGDVLRLVRKEIEATIPKYRGVHQIGASYQKNDMATRGGGLWICTRSTTGTPGASSDWTLAVKSGQRGD
jgi:hypothetical protein